jgi:hypothetical protein
VAFQLPRLSLSNPITDPTTGKPTTLLQRWWASLAQQIETQEDNQDTALSQIQAALALAGTGVVNTDAGGTTAKSGQNTATGLTVNSSSFIHGPLVALTAVTAGMPHLTLTGSAPQAAVSAAGPMDGEYRIVEVVAGVDSLIFSDTFHVKTLNTGATILTLDNPVNTQIFTRSAIGAVSYRLDVRKTAGAGEADSLQAYLFARRAP